MTPKNARILFEKEEGWHPATDVDRKSSRYKNEYIEWLEEYGKQQYEAGAKAQREADVKAIERCIEGNLAEQYVEVKHEPLVTNQQNTQDNE